MTIRARFGGVGMVSRAHVIEKFISEVLGNSKVNQILVDSLTEISAETLMLHPRAAEDANDSHSKEIAGFGNFLCDRNELEIIREKLAKAGAESGREIKILEFSGRQEGREGERGFDERK